MGTTAPAVATAAGGEQSALNLLLVLAQPGEILVQIVFVEAAPDAEHIAGGMHLGQADGRETRTLVQEAGNFGGGPDGADGSAFLQLNAVEGGEGGQIARYSRHPNLPIRIARCGNRSTKPDGLRVTYGNP